MYCILSFDLRGAFYFSVGLLNLEVLYIRPKNRFPLQLFRLPFCACQLHMFSMLFFFFISAHFSLSHSTLTILLFNSIYLGPFLTMVCYLSFITVDNFTYHLLFSLIFPSLISFIVTCVFLEVFHFEPLTCSAVS